MRTRYLVLCGICLFLGGVSAFALQYPEDAKKSALQVDLEYRALSPGEILRVALSGSPDILQAHVRFSGEKYIFWKNEKTGKHLAFMGLDLDFQPGNYPVSVAVQMKDGSLEIIDKEIRVIPKEFPVKKL